jgi:hypothetical protein
MERTVLHVVLGDATGAMWGALFFLALSLGLGYAVWAIVKRLACMGSLGESRVAGDGVGIALGVLISLGVFMMFYASSLSGFYDLQLRGDQVVLHYLFPDRYVTRSTFNLVKVEKEPAFKSQWRLVVHDVDGGVYQSTPGSLQDVQGAWTLLQPMIEPEALFRP